MTWRSYPSAPSKRHDRESPPFTDARTQAIAEALDPEVHKRIRDRAREEAARVLREWESRRRP